jgi:hypothetical protein
MANKNNKTKLKFELAQALMFPGFVAGVSNYTSISEDKHEDSNDDDQDQSKTKEE